MERKKKIDIYDANHPFRGCAIHIIENVIEPLLQRGIDGEKYYELEDNLTKEINKNLKQLIK